MILATLLKKYPTVMWGISPPGGEGIVLGLWVFKLKFYLFYDFTHSMEISFYLSVIFFHIKHRESKMAYLPDMYQRL